MNSVHITIQEAHGAHNILRELYALHFIPPSAHDQPPEVYYILETPTGVRRGTVAPVRHDHPDLILSIVRRILAKEAPFVPANKGVALRPQQ